MEPPLPRAPLPVGPSCLSPLAPLVCMRIRPWSPPCVSSPCAYQPWLVLEPLLGFRRVGEPSRAGAAVRRAGGPGCTVRLPALSCSLSCLAQGDWKEGGRRGRSKNERGCGSCAPCSAGWKSLALLAQQVGQVGALPASDGFSRLGCCLRQAAVQLSSGSPHLSLLDS